MSVVASFLPFYLALLFSSAVIGAIALRARYERSPGFAALLYPFSLLIVSGVLESLRALTGTLGAESAALATAASAFRLLNGLGWLLMCHAHLGLHGLLDWRRRLTAPAVALTAACFAAYLLSVALGAFESIALAVGLAFMSATGLYAALTAILALRKAPRLWPSSRAGVRMALFAIVFYPASLLAERVGVMWPFLDPDRTVFEQMYPLYMAVFAALAVPALLSREKGSLAEPGDARAAASLTDREREIALLLRDGKTLKEIAIELSVSVATVKSHSNAAYRKLGVSGRKELRFVNLR